MAIKIDNIEMGMIVLTKYNGIGKIIDLRLNENNRIYAIIKLDKDNNIIEEPIDRLINLDKNKQ